MACQRQMIAGQQTAVSDQLLDHRVEDRRRPVSEQALARLLPRQPLAQGMGCMKRRDHVDQPVSDLRQRLGIDEQVPNATHAAGRHEAVRDVVNRLWGTRRPS